MKPDRRTKENREFWAFVERTASEVRTEEQEQGWASNPVTVSGEHVASTDCWCEPEEESPGVWVHKELQ